MHTYAWHVVRRLGDASADCGDPTSPKILKMQILIASVSSLLVSQTKVYYFINDTLETFVETFPSASTFFVCLITILVKKEWDQRNSDCEKERRL